MKVEVYTSEACRVGEIVLIGGQEAKTVLYKGSLVLRFPLERNLITVRSLSEDEFLQAEGERLCLYRRRTDADIHH